MAQSYQIRLPQFEGPFDLLLFFIERDELDIHNIPIHKLTTDFLNYIKELEQLNIELASEFILFASTLMRIKAKMLLPRKEKDEAGNDVDPRQELIEKLLEYKRFKEAAEEMNLLEAERMLLQKRGNIHHELDTLGHKYAEGTEIQTITMYKLMNTFDRVIRKLEDRLERPQHVVVKYNYTMEGQRTFLTHYMQQHKNVSFETLFMNLTNRIEAIFTFLAMLELIQLNIFSIEIGEGERNDFNLAYTGVDSSLN